MRRWLGVKGSTRNGHRDPKCSSARHFGMFREDTGVPNGDATCAWMAADVRGHFLRCGDLLNDWFVEGVLRLVFV
ncbi:hypothetical protein TNCV_871031 [Trichonephila clavipes]|nr:hypothetical protein TNCV_871031 [Trichonephila clavipes]